MGLNLNTPQTKNYTGLNPVRSGSTAEPDYNVKYTPQDLTEAQQAQARQNIGAAAAGEGGATINEFHYLRDTTTDPATFYIDADGYEPKEGDLITIIWDWPFRTNESEEVAFKNPATLKNNTTNPSIYVKNAHQMATDYDEIDPEVNTRWTVRLEKVNDVWYAYNISTAVQADWSTIDRNAPSFIKNKPSFPSFPTVDNPFLVDRKTFYVYSTSNQAQFSARMDWHWDPINGITTHDASSNTLVSTYSGLTVIHSGQYWTMGGCSGNPGGGELWIWLNYGFTNGSMSMSDPSQPVNLVVAGEYDNQTYDTLINSDANNMYYVWSLDNCQRTEYNKYGNFVLADVPIRGQIFMETPDSLINCNIHVPKTRLAEFTTYMTNAFGQQVVEDYILPKVSTYDFIAQCGWTMKMITLPTLPLTMTDANNNTISGDFVAQNITITPGV